MKKFLASLTAFLLVIIMVMPVMADDIPEKYGHVVDGADILSDSEESKLTNLLDEISDRYDLDVVILTADGCGRYTSEEFAEDFYDYNGYKRDGIILFLDMEKRNLTMSGCGYGIHAFTDAGRDYILDQIADDLHDNNFYSAFKKYADLCDDFIKQAKDGEPYDVKNLPKGSFPIVKYILISLGIGFLISVIINLVLRSQLKSVRPNNKAVDYVVQGSMNVTNSYDIFLYRKVSSVRKSQSSGGGSTTHRSSSGRTHSSTSRKF